MSVPKEVGLLGINRFLKNVQEDIALASVGWNQASRFLAFTQWLLLLFKNRARELGSGLWPNLPACQPGTCHAEGATEKPIRSRV